MNFSIEEDFWALFPAARIGVIIAPDIDNKAADDEVAMLLEEATVQIGAALQESTVAEADIGIYQAVALWREAYRGQAKQVEVCQMAEVSCGDNRQRQQW